MNKVLHDVIIILQMIAAASLLAFGLIGIQDARFAVLIDQDDGGVVDVSYYITAYSVIVLINILVLYIGLATENRYVLCGALFLFTFDVIFLLVSVMPIMNMIQDAHVPAFDVRMRDYDTDVMCWTGFNVSQQGDTIINPVCCLDLNHRNYGKCARCRNLYNCDELTVIQVASVGILTTLFVVIVLKMYVLLYAMVILNGVLESDEKKSDAELSTLAASLNDIYYYDETYRKPSMSTFKSFRDDDMYLEWDRPKKIYRNTL
ncbi:ARIF-1 [Operophtera brumata nucleopolyhedrovirus]|uniref:ARIF-1 n=1 Tax=Operophtera brumata nucleopolyhedrovirus TaxID=1046267 RepID=A0A2H4V001_9ABAC|nr:ARIF-1 [Operophtera brumata nucleopolyhedrovirus]AUA60356.1 ARIF-1 [Operophtera brumata nucleopolyhedrovirus]